MPHIEQDKTRLKDDAWDRIWEKLKTIHGIKIGTPWTCHRFVEAVLWILRAGGQWRSLPAERGNWNSIFKRFARWSDKGVWDQIHATLVEGADLQDVSIDSTTARAHACAAGAAKSSADHEALGRSRGGFGCKIHAAVDGLGMPIRFILTGGQAADITQGIPLMKDILAEACLAVRAD